MKKWIAMLLALLMIGGAVASGEDFVLRKGIVFGDTKADVLRKEDTLVKSHPDDDDDFWFKGRIAGFDNGECRFDFDDYGKLNGLFYTFGSQVNTSKSVTDDNYQTLYDTLVRKYGAPLGNTGGTIDLITGAAFDNMAAVIYLFGSLDGITADYSDYAEWIVRCDNYNVKIDLVKFYYYDTSYDYTYYINVSYLKYTDAERDAKIREKQNEQSEVESDL